MPLTDMQARKAKPTEHPYKLADGGGLFLMVQPNGSKLWRMKYRHEGREKLFSFGSYPELGIATAREKRLHAKASLLEAVDPSLQKTPPKPAANTFGVIAQQWHANRRQSLDEAHAQRVWSRLERNVLPVLGDLPCGATIWIRKPINQDNNR